MAKRQLILNDYRTAEDGLWTLASCKITKAAQVQTFLSVPGRYSPLDLSTASSDGEPYYGNAALEAVLESSEGTREERQNRIQTMVNLLDGYSVVIIHPDHPDRYLVGRVQINPEYNDPVHCAVRVSAICEPWLYNIAETMVDVTVTGTAQTVELTNAGRLAVVPTIKVNAAEVTLVYGTITQTLTTGGYQLPDLYLTPGTHSIVISGTGRLAFLYREAVLAE